MEKTSFKFLALGGIAGPVLFTTVTLICASLRPGFNHVSQFISELGATGTPNARLMNFAGFMPSGAMIAAYGVSLILLLPKGLLARTGSVWITLFGLGVIVAGSFSCDPGCPRVGSLENTIHDQISGPVFLSAIIGMLLLGISFRNSPLWRGLWVYSVLSALLSFGFIVALVNSIDSYTLTGMWQRLLLATIFLWCGIVGQQVFKLAENTGIANRR